MPCRHKFYEELTLENLTYTPETLIVGTFNPAWPEENQAKWFYGRTHDEYGYQSNNFWDVLPRVYNEYSLINRQPKDWKQFCRRNAIAITDLISEITDADPQNSDHVQALRGYGDKQIATLFKQHKFVSIPQILQENPAIKNVYLTRGAQGFWLKRWSLIQNDEMHDAKHIQTLITPSDWSRIQHRIYNKKNPNQYIADLSNFILMRWKSVWHFQ